MQILKDFVVTSVFQTRLMTVYFTAIQYRATEQRSEDKKLCCERSVQLPASKTNLRQAPPRLNIRSDEYRTLQLMTHRPGPTIFDDDVPK